MGGTSLAFARRSQSRLFTERVFVGNAIDIGAGPDPLTDRGFPLLRSVREWDLKEGDATYMQGVESASYDVVHSSHCLEHIDDPDAALLRWWELVKVGGHLVLVVPDEELYERHVWPSTRNADHRTAFSTRTFGSLLGMPNSVLVHNLADWLQNGRIISLLRLEDGFDPSNPFDQTALGTCECGIELVIRKEA